MYNGEINVTIFVSEFFDILKQELECISDKRAYEHGSQNTTPGLNDKKSSLFGNERCLFWQSLPIYALLTVTSAITKPVH
jgi:hypothetical protein